MDTAVDDVDASRILLVDDQPDLAEVTARHLETRRDTFEVVLASGGPAALDVLDRTTVDCVVSDYEMPEMDGLDLLRAVTERDPSLPFILYTGRGSEEIASEAISAGVTDYLQKRTTSDQYDVLANRIENAVARRRSERAREESESRYRTLVEASPHAILVHYGEDVVYVNDTMVQLFGFEAQAQVHGTEAMSYVHPDDRDAVRERMHMVLDDREESDWIAWRLLRDDGQIREVESRGTPVVYDGRTAVQVVVRDLTDQRRRERQLGSLTGILEELSTVETRTGAAETAVESAAVLFEDSFAIVFEHVEGTLLELAVSGTGDAVGIRTAPRDGTALPPDGVELATVRAGTPRVVEDYGTRADALTDAVATLFLRPLGDDGLLWVGSTRGFDAPDRDLLSILGRAVADAFDRSAD